MVRDPKVDRLAQVDLFAGLDDRALGALAGIVDEVTFPDGGRLCREGETGSEALVLTAGRARVTHAGRHVATLDAPAVAGELALVTKRPRVAGVTAEGQVSALSVPANAFDGLLDDHPSIARRLLRVLADRVVAADLLAVGADPADPDPAHPDPADG